MGRRNSAPLNVACRKSAALQRLAEADHEADVRVLLHELRDRLPRVIRSERRRRGELRGHAMLLGKRLREEDVVEHLHQPDAAPVALGRQPAKHLDVLREHVRRHFDGLGVILQLHQRREWMAVPEVKRVHAVRGEEVQVLTPEHLVVEPREQLRRVGVFVSLPPRQDGGLLHPDACAAQGHGGLVGKIRD